MTDTPGEQAARASLAASAVINKGQQLLTEESRLMLAALLRDEMRVAVAEGIQAAMTPEAAERFWTTGIELLQKHAAQKVGRLALDGLTQVLKKMMWIGVFLFIAYSIGGWSLFKTMWAAVVNRS